MQHRMYDRSAPFSGGAGRLVRVGEGDSVDVLKQGRCHQARNSPRPLEGARRLEHTHFDGRRCLHEGVGVEG